MTVTAALVKELRDRTGAGMMECKKALSQTNGDIEQAIEELRKSGIAKAGKKSSRIAAEGNIFVEMSADRKSALILEVNCETDFVGRDENFVKFGCQVAKRALAAKTSDTGALLSIAFDNNGGDTIEETRQALVAKLGENIQLRRCNYMTSDGAITHYKHGDRIGVLVAINKVNDELGRDVAMHIAAMKPTAISASDVSQELINKEREIFSAQAQSSGKPADIVQKMIDGRIKKFLDEVSLSGQPFVKDPSKTVGSLLSTSDARVSAFVRYEVGEGIEKEEVDFAKEVMDQVKGTA